MTKNVAIIGSGVGGLATAVRLLHNGFNVTIFEKDSLIGGKTNQLCYENFSFDLSASIMMLPDKYKELFTYVNKDYKDYFTLIPLDPIYKIFFKDSTTLDISSKFANCISSLESISKRDSAGYINLLNDVYRKYLNADKFFLEKSHNSFMNFISPLNLYHMLKLNPFSTSYNYISKHIRNEKLRDLLCFQSMYVGVSPYESSNIYTLVPVTSQLYGLYHIQGGMYSYIKALEKLIYELGGSIETNKEVKEIIIENNKAIGILLDSNKKTFFDTIVCNCDFPYAIKTLIKDSNIKNKYVNEKIDKMKHSCSTFILHLGLSKKYDILNVHNIFINNNFKKNIEAAFKGYIPQNGSYYIYNPSHVDSTMSKNDTTALNIMLRVPNLTFKNIIWNKNQILKLRNQILNDICSINGLEDLKDNIVFEHYTTPVDFKERFNSYAGCAFGISQTLTQTNYFRPQAFFPGISNLYFVGASTHPGTGVSMVLTSSKLCADEILSNS